MQRRRLKEERDHHPLPGDPERHPSPDRGAQQPQHHAVSGERRPGRKTQGPHCTIRPARGGMELTTHTAVTSVPDSKSRYSTSQKGQTVFSLCTRGGGRVYVNLTQCAHAIPDASASMHSLPATFTLVLLLLDTVVQAKLSEQEVKYLSV